MEKIPKDWVNKIFDYLSNWYGDRWIFPDRPINYEAIRLATWQTGLAGLTKDQIKNALAIYKRLAQNQDALPPHVIDFFLCATGKKVPPIIDDSIMWRTGNTEVAKEHLSHIKQQLGIRK